MLLLALAIVAAAAGASAATPPSSCPGVPNNSGMFEFAATRARGAAAVYAEAPNGRVYLEKRVSPALYVVHVWGTPYERGHALGTMLKAELREFFAAAADYLDAQVGQYLKFIPEPLRSYVEEFGVWAALEFTLIATRSYTPPWHAAEMRGMADATGLELAAIERFNLMPELVKAHCSMVGADGDATPAGTTLAQLRALDFITDGPFQRFPALVVYHADAAANNTDAAGTPAKTYVNVGWLGFQGAVTGFSAAPLGLSQKVWLSYNGSSTREGYPFHYLLRDLLEFASSPADAGRRMRAAPRTCSVFVGLGGSTPFSISRYAYESVVDYAPDAAWPGHPYVKDVMYLNKHRQPSHDSCLGELLQAARGNITAEWLARTAAGRQQSGDLHWAAYDYARMRLLVANAQPTGPNYAPAYTQPIVAFDLRALFAEQRPQKPAAVVAAKVA